MFKIATNLCKRHLQNWPWTNHSGTPPLIFRQINSASQRRNQTLTPPTTIPPPCKLASESTRKQPRRSSLPVLSSPHSIPRLLSLPLLARAHCCCVVRTENLAGGGARRRLKRHKPCRRSRASRSFISQGSIKCARTQRARERESLKGTPMSFALEGRERESKRESSRRGNRGFIKFV